MSYFMTEKFGTITLINQPVKSKVESQKSDLKDLGLYEPSPIKYELTPLRTESNYEDHRHPGEIIRSNDVLLDSDRRDFTVNCLYYSNVPYKAEYAKLLDTKNIHKYTDDETFLKRLDDHGYLYIKDQNILIVQDHKHIAQLFVDGNFQSDHLIPMLKSATVFTINKKIEIYKNLRILIDPHK